jgi:hypothetical protein
MSENPDLHTLTPERWSELVGPVQDRILGVLFDAAGCGPFDGGCLVFAEALRKTIGGEIVVLVRRDDSADHAAVSAGRMLWDFDGPNAPEQFVRQFNINESAHCTDQRDIAPGDLPDAIRDEALQGRIGEILEEVLGDYFPVPASLLF